MGGVVVRERVRMYDSKILLYLMKEMEGKMVMMMVNSMYFDVHLIDLKRISLFESSRSRKYGPESIGKNEGDSENEKGKKEVKET
jgi:hypothetical protein